MPRILRFTLHEFEANMSGAMLAVMIPPDVAGRIACPEGEKPDMLHITLFFFGEAVDLPQDIREKIIAATMTAMASEVPFEIELAGTDIFEENEERPLFACVESDPLLELRATIAREFDRAGIQYSKDFEYHPHCTLRYLGKDPDPKLDIHESFIVEKIEAVFAQDHVRLAIPEVSMQFAKEKEGGIKQRFAPGEWERATNRQQRRLTKAYDTWSASARKALVNLARSGGTIQEQHALFEKLLRALQLQLQQIYGRGIEIAKNISAGARADLPAVNTLAEEHTREGLDLIATALIPAIMMKLSVEIARGAAEDPQMLRDAFLAPRTLPSQYAGGFWVMIFDTQKTLGKERELERISQGLTIEPIRWVLDPHAVHCQHSGDHYGCMELEGEYPSGWNSLKTVPAGQTTCRGNCKCHIEVYRDGAWRRGVYEA